MINSKISRNINRSSNLTIHFYGVIIFILNAIAAHVAVAKTDTVNRIDITGEHPRKYGVWPQYQALETALGKNVVITSAITDLTKFENWQCNSTAIKKLSNQNPNNYDSIHNHYQNFLSEVWNSSSGVNAVSIWGDATAIAQGSGAWGGSLALDRATNYLLVNPRTKEVCPLMWI